MLDGVIAPTWSDCSGITGCKFSNLLRDSQTMGPKTKLYYPTRCSNLRKTQAESSVAAAVAAAATAANDDAPPPAADPHFAPSWSRPEGVRFMLPDVLISMHSDEQ